MKISSKVFWFFILSTVPIIIAINLVFGLFYQNFILNQENQRFSAIRQNLSFFIMEKEEKYLGSINDWSHWDDTYDFVSNLNTEYINENMVPDTFNNLDLSFIIFTNKDNNIIKKYYYDFYQNAFSAFPANFLDDFKYLLKAIQSKDDTAGIYSLGNQFYFIATSPVTDSEKIKSSNGKMITGRLIDQSIIANIEKNLGCSIDSIKSINSSNISFESPLISVKSFIYSQNNESIHAELLISNSLDNQSSPVFSITIARDIYMDGMQAVPAFSAFNTIIIALLFVVIYKVLSKQITKPFGAIIKDVQKIDFNKVNKIIENSKYEFLYLRKTINKMLEKIEGEQNKVRNSEERLYSTLISVGDGVITIGTDGRVQLLNPVAHQLTGWSQEEAFGRPVEDVFCIVNEYTREQVESPASLVLKYEKIVQLSNHTLLLSKDGTEKPIEDTAAPIKDKSGTIIGCVLVFKDVSEKKEKQKHIEYLSYHDQLTGIYNRRYFEEETKRLDTVRNLPISFIYADINGLKIMNDAFGHEKGDELIQQVAALMKKECRADDIIARTGGDEFILLLPKTDQKTVNIIIKRIKEVSKKVSLMDISLSISLGWATKTSEEQDILEILKNAEDLMYQKKILSNHSKRSGIIKSILNALHVKNVREEAHSQRVSQLCELIGKAYGLEEDEVRELRLAGTLHDIGKIELDEDVLNKSDKLTESDWAKIKKHPETGYRILGTSSEFYHISEYVLAHHEKWDGTGYPRGLKGTIIPWKARIIAVADAYDAMTCERPYRKTFSREDAVEEIKKCAGTQFDPDVAKVFVEKVLGIDW